MIILSRADARRIPLPDESVHACICSPPYWGLRDYGTGQWEGGDVNCSHIDPAGPVNAPSVKSTLRGDSGKPPQPGEKYHSSATAQYRDVCARCGARRIDRQLGLEQSPDEYVAALVAVFREVKRVLRKDGTAWLNLGDSYAGSGKGRNADGTHQEGGKQGTNTGTIVGLLHKTADQAIGLKPKDLCMIPARVALALQQPFYTGRIKKECDRHWLAGLVDGEGCFGIRKQKSSGKVHNPAWNDSYIPYFTIKMSDTQAIEKAIAITGWGRIRPEYSKVGYDKRKVRTNRPPQTWRLDGNKAVQIARELYPYLVIKQHQAACLHTIDVSNKNRRRGRGNAVPASVIQERERMFVYIKALNQRQEPPTPSWLQIPPSLYEPGWYLRSDIIWAKGLSFCPTYSGSVMPESVRDRPTQSYEHVFLLAKRKTYYYDADAVREAPTESSIQRNKYGQAASREPGLKVSREQQPGEKLNPAGRNLRSVWTINPKPSKLAHYAAFPPALVEPMVLAATSAKGCCPRCKAPWERVVRRDVKPPPDRIHNNPFKHDTMTTHGEGAHTLRNVVETETVGWQPTCTCGTDLEPVPAIILDCFGGTMTVGEVCAKHGRHFVGLDLKHEYVQMGQERINNTQMYLGLDG